MANCLWKSAVAVPFLVGCYQYVPVEHAGLPPSTPVSIDLSTRGTLDVANKIGNNVVAVDGYLTASAGSSITLALQGVHRRGETAVSEWNGESITLTTDDIEQVKRKQLSRSRTALASAAFTAASVGVVVGIAKATGTASGSIGGKPSPNP